MQVERSFTRILAKSERPLLFLAHQEDELACSGILQRLRDRIRVVFMTNGDGPARSTGEEPVQYTAIRKAETLKSLETAGVPGGQVRFLGHSEIEILRNITRVKKAPLRLSEAVAFFEPIRRSMAEVVYELRPDVVFAVAYQGGHPEHDLAHFFGALALRNYAKDAEADIPLYQFPEYFLTSLLPGPLGHGGVGESYWVVLDTQEWKTKQRMAECYASEHSGIRKFRRIVGLATLPQRILRRGEPLERFFGREQISRVPGDFDYGRVPYRLDFLNYFFEDFEGTPITFQDSVRPLVVAFEEASGRGD
jgi:LmbE family N-acetylglucosaminyl deacetylase